MPTQEEFSITFGFPEFWPEVVKRHKNFFGPGMRASSKPSLVLPIGLMKDSTQTSIFY
jgi:hypothetical protein